MLQWFIRIPKFAEFTEFNENSIISKWEKMALGNESKWLQIVFPNLSSI